MSRHADVMHSGIDTAICYIVACVLTMWGEA
jgi:hypothetical protein